jgi:predicted DNA-binding antitoxin AbrB/MazE fold protein
MSLTIEAVYENGVLKPAHPLPLKPLPLMDHERVRLTIEPAMPWAERTAGMLRWTGDPEILRPIAEDDEFSILESP